MWTVKQWWVPYIGNKSSALISPHQQLDSGEFVPSITWSFTASGLYCIVAIENVLKQSQASCLLGAPSTLPVRLLTVTRRRPLASWITSLALTAAAAQTKNICSRAAADAMCAGLQVAAQEISFFFPLYSDQKTRKCGKLVPKTEQCAKVVQESQDSQSVVLWIWSCSSLSNPSPIWTGLGPNLIRTSFWSSLSGRNPVGTFPTQIMCPGSDWAQVLRLLYPFQSQWDPILEKNIPVRIWFSSDFPFRQLCLRSVLDRLQFRGL